MPSIAYQELSVLCVAVFTWEKLLENCRIVIYRDNQLVVEMVNKTSSSCKNCMILIRKLVLNNLEFNRRISVIYLKSEQNVLADSLSRGQFELFWKNAPNNMRRVPDPVLEELWPVEKLWVKD